ncbi:MAG: MarR family transcriptional regulator [Lachnospiraceae bacterium]|nr:MarR family transcriptional regulator [Lachnospiraceae bacterium]
MKEQDIGFWLKQINDKLRMSADASLKKSGLTMSQTRIMEFLYEKGGQATQKEIENYLEVSHPTVVGMVSRLEKNGFLTCCVDKTDRRNKIVCTTDKAVESAEMMFQGRKETENRLLKSLGEEEIEELRRLLKILYKNIE